MLTGLLSEFQLDTPKAAGVGLRLQVISSFIWHSCSSPFSNPWTVSNCVQMSGWNAMRTDGARLRIDGQPPTSLQTTEKE